VAGVFQKAIEASIEARQLQPEKIILLKIIQTYEVKLTRHGIDETHPSTLFSHIVGPHQEFFCDVTHANMMWY